MIIDVMCLVIKNYIEIIFLDSVLTEKQARKKFFFYIYFLFSSSFSAIFMFKVNPNTILSTFMSIIIMLSYLLFYKDKWIKKLIFLVVLIVLVVVCELISGIILLIMDVSVNTFETNILYSFILLTFTSILLFLSTLTIKIISNKDVTIKTNILFLFYPTSSILILYALYCIVMFNLDSAIKYVIFLIVALLVLLSNLFLVYLITYLVKSKTDKLLLEYYEKCESLEKSHVKELDQSKQEIKQINHDLKSHFLHLLGLINAQNYDGCRIYVMKFLDLSKRIDYLFSTGYDGLDAVLSSKAIMSKSKHIFLKTVITMPTRENLKINEADISIICANVLDNAIEATEQCPVSDRIIDIQICYDGNLSYLRICCQNPTINTSASYKTTKKDKENHGYGLTIIQKVAEKWDGMVQYETKDGIFSIIVSLHN